MQIIAQNRKAYYSYFIDQKFEAGIVLMGSELKSMRKGRVNIAEAYVDERQGEIFLINAHISEYHFAGSFGHTPLRPRKLLLHKREINKLIGSIQRKGYTIVPLRCYFNAVGKAKVEIALVKGKKAYDKRETEKKRDWQREKSRIIKEHR